MIKRLALFLLLACCTGFAQTTTFTANTKDLATVLPATPEAGPVYLELTLKNCAGSGATPTIPHVNGTGVIVFPVNLYPDGTGLISKTVYDQTFIVCGSSTGVAYYHIRVYQGDNTRSLVKKLLFEDDFDVQGASFNLNSATPRSGSVISPPVATAVLTNPAGNQTIVQPVGTSLSINRLSASFAQNANGADAIAGSRFTDTSPTGNFFNFKNAALTTPLWQVDVTGTLTAGIIPNARLVTPAAGTGTCTFFVRALNAAAAPTCDFVHSSDLGASLSLVTPNIGAATGTSLNLGGTGVLSTTAQSGTGSHCMTTNCVMTTPNIGAATGTSLNFNNSATGRNATLTVGGTSSSTGGISVFVGASGAQNERLAVDPADGSTSAVRVGSLSVRTLSAGFLSGTELAKLDSTGLTMTGSTSGTTLLKPIAVASGTLTLPAATDTLVAKATTDTLTNKTLTSPAFTGTETGMSITSPNFNTGISQGSGFKHQRFGATNATAASAGATSLTAYTWTSAFADANYTVTCTGINQSNTPTGPALESITASGFSARVSTILAAASSFGGLDCIAIHD